MSWPLRLTLLLVSCHTPVLAAFDFPAIDVEVHGYIDGGVVVTDDHVGWLDHGPGKGRYGDDGDGDFEAVLPEASIIGDLSVGTAWRAHLHLKFDDEQRHFLDVGEAYLAYRAPPHAGLRWRARIGTFLPPVSLENHAVGWTSPYTLWSSALNTWVGEELRVNGGEAKLLFDVRQLEIGLFGAGFFANDAAGTLIAMRGWAVHDRKLALFDRAPLPAFQIRLVNPFGPFRGQVANFEPLHEIDGRPGFYAGADLKHAQIGRFKLIYYDNNADPEAFNRSAGQYAWRTRFGAVGYRGEVVAGLTLVTQLMYGDTVMGPRLFPGSARRISDVDFFTGYGLLSKRLSRWRFTARGEYFETRNRDLMRGGYDGAEDGYGVTLSVGFKPVPASRINAELQYLDHTRPVRALAGEPLAIDELTLRINYRFLF